MENHKATDLGGKKTLVEEGTEFKGSLSSNCPVVVKGRVEGDVTAPSLHVSASGAVHGKVKVGQIESQGELSGEFDADTVQLSGVIKDKTVVRAKSLEVKLTPQNGKMQVVFGDCTLDIGEMPSQQAAVSASRDGDKAPAPAVVAPAVVVPAVVAPAVVASGSFPPPAFHGPNGSPSSPPGRRDEPIALAAPGLEAAKALLADSSSEFSEPSPRKRSSAPPGSSRRL